MNSNYITKTAAGKQLNKQKSRIKSMLWVDRLLVMKEFIYHRKHAHVWDCVQGTENIETKPFESAREIHRRGVHGRSPVRNLLKESFQCQKTAPTQKKGGVVNFMRGVWGEGSDSGWSIATGN